MNATMVESKKVTNKKLPKTKEADKKGDGAEGGTTGDGIQSILDAAMGLTSLKTPSPPIDEDDGGKGQSGGSVSKKSTTKKPAPAAGKSKSKKAAKASGSAMKKGGGKAKAKSTKAASKAGKSKKTKKRASRTTTPTTSTAADTPLPPLLMQKNGQMMGLPPTVDGAAEGANPSSQAEKNICPESQRQLLELRKQQRQMEESYLARNGVLPAAYEYQTAPVTTRVSMDTSQHNLDAPQQEQRKIPSPVKSESDSTKDKTQQYPFPETLYEILSQKETAHILSWLPHGKGFVIHDKDLFSSEILPRHFDGAKYTSFTRRLKRWKFERVTRGPEFGAYYNENFIRDRPDLVRGIAYGMDADGKQLVMKDGASGAKKGGAKKKFEARDDADSVAKGALVDPKEKEGQRKRGSELKTSGGSNKRSKSVKHEATTSFGEAYDDAVVEAAMRSHRLRMNQSMMSSMPSLRGGFRHMMASSSAGFPSSRMRYEEQLARLRQGHSSIYSSMMYNANPDEHLAVMSRRRMAGLAGATSGNASNFPDAESVFQHNATMLNQERFRQSRLNLISPPDGEQQKKCLNDIEQRVLSEMSSPNLKAQRLVTLSPGGSPAPERLSLSLSNGPPFASKDNLMIREMTQKIMASTNTHKEIMMMAARNLNSQVLARSRSNSGAGMTELLLQQEEMQAQRSQALQSQMAKANFHPMQQHQGGSMSTTLTSRLDYLKELQAKVGDEMTELVGRGP